MTASTKPTILVVPGAWHSPSHYAPLITHLQSLRYPATSSRLPSVGSPEPKSQTATTDAAYIRNELLLPLLNAGTDVVLVLHSYSGIPGGAAAKGLSKQERAARGEKGGVVGLVFLTAFVALEGESLVQLVGGKLDTWITIDEAAGIMTIPAPAPIFYNGVPAPLTADAISTCLPQAHSSFTSPSPAPAWPDDVWNGRRAYIVCTDDHAIPAVAQRAIVERSGVEWEVEEVAEGHSPFLSTPAVIAGLVAGWAGKWTAVDASGLIDG